MHRAPTKVLVMTIVAANLRMKMKVSLEREQRGRQFIIGEFALALRSQRQTRRLASSAEEVGQQTHRLAIPYFISCTPWISDLLNDASGRYFCLRHVFSTSSCLLKTLKTGSCGIYIIGVVLRRRTQAPTREGLWKTRRRDWTKCLPAGASILGVPQEQIRTNTKHSGG